MICAENRRGRRVRQTIKKNVRLSVTALFFVYWANFELNASKRKTLEHHEIYGAISLT
jgi:hypothetical protein